MSGPLGSSRTFVSVWPGPRAARGAVLAPALAALVLVACGERMAGAPPAPPLDTTPGPRPPDALGEVELDAEATLGALATLVDDEALRALAPARLVDLVESSVALPRALRDRIRPERGARALVFEVDPEPDTPAAAELVWAFAIEPLAPAAASGGEETGEGPLATEPGAPQGALWVVGEPVAVAGDVVVAGPSRARVAAALPYLAFAAMPREVAPSTLAATATRALLLRLARPLFDRALADVAGDARASAEAAVRAHAEEPVLGAPDRFVDRVHARLSEWIALLPDVAEARLSLRAEDARVALEVDLAVDSGSPLEALAAAAPETDVSTALGALPERTALALVLGSTPEARRARTERWVADVADVAGARLSAEERAALEASTRAWDEALGAVTAWALGRTDAGPFALVASHDAPALAAGGPDAALAPFWGSRARPYETALLGLLAGCDPTEPPRGALPLALCGRARLDAARAPEGGVAAAVAPDDAGTIAARTLAALRAGRAVLGSSPDVARALSPHAAPGFLALAVIPSRLVPLLGAVEGLPAPSPAPPAAIVVSARRAAAGHLSLVATADARAVRDALRVARGDVPAP